MLAKPLVLVHNRLTKSGIDAIGDLSLDIGRDDWPCTLADFLDVSNFHSKIQAAPQD